MSESAAIALSHVSYHFGSSEVLRDITLSLPEGRIYGLLGRNGAGKSTLIRLLTAQLMPQAGEIRVFSRAPHMSPSTLGQMCLVGDAPDFGTARTVREAIQVAQSLHPRFSAEMARALTERFELNEKKRIKGLSRGMQTALCLACGLASGAPLTLFDEPSLGLDAVIRERFYDAVLEIQRGSAYKRTIILSTHLIDEVARALDHAVMLDKGAIVLDSDISTLREQHTGDEPFSLQRLFVSLTEHDVKPLPCV